MPIKKLKKKSVKSSSNTNKRISQVEYQMSILERSINDMAKAMRGHRISIANTVEASKEINESLESSRRLCGAVHKEASDFIDYLKQARLEIDEFKETTMKEIKALAQRTKKYSLDDNKEILLEDD